MRNWHRYAFVLVGGFGVSASSSLLASGCGGSNNTTTSSSGNTSSSSSGPSSSTGSTSSSGQSKTTDGGSDASDSGGAETGVADSTVSDSPEGDARQEVDAADASEEPVTPMYDGSIFAFPTAVAAAECTQLAYCCGMDAATFNVPLCVTYNVDYGYNGTLQGVAPLLDSGTIALDPVAAQTCLSDIAAVDCSANILSDQTQLKITRSCGAAVIGVLDAGSPCGETIQCAGEQYCQTGVDGGQFCAPLVGDGGSCISSSVVSGQQACSLRGTGLGGLRCNDETLDGSAQPLDAASWMCEPEQDAGAPCNQNYDCNTDICSSGVCVTAAVFSAPVICQIYAIPDAGGAD